MRIRFFLFLLLFLLVYETGLVVFTDFLKRPPWVDEWHFVPTIKKFCEEISLRTIKNYEEYSTPLPFILYALWGRAFGCELMSLRIFSLIIAFLTYISFYFLSFSLLKNEKLSLALTLFLSLNPYMIGLSVFVYTDMITILFLILAMFGIVRKNPLSLFLFSACALLSRQYSVFFLTGAGIYFLVKAIKNVERRRSLIMISAIFASCIPLLFLFFLWKGPSPIGFPEGEAGFHMNSLFLYILLFPVYLLPILIFRWRFIYQERKRLLFALLPASLYFFFPVTPSPFAVRWNIHTVGFFHRFLLHLLKNRWAVHCVFFLFFWAGLLLVHAMLRDIYFRMRKSIPDIPLLLDLITISFLFIMPFSYLHWEKYIIPLLPFLSIRLLFPFRVSVRWLPHE